MSSPPLAPGDVVCGEFTIARVVGEDPLTTVYEATSARRPGEAFTVRAAAVTRARTPGAAAAFRRQMAALESFEHPAIPALLDFELLEGAAVIVTRAVGLRSLRAWLAAPEGLSHAMVARVILAVASALASLHRRPAPITHGLLCPETIAATPGGDARLEACGFVHALVSARLVARLDAAHRAPAYLSPGALRGELRPRDDTFALASVAFECLTGTPAFRGDSREAVLAALTEGPRPSAHALRADLPPELDAVFAKAWSPDAGAGYASIVAFARDLEDALATPARRPVSKVPAAARAPASSPAPRAATPAAPARADAPSPPRASRVPWILGGAVVIAAVVETASRVLVPSTPVAPPDEAAVAACPPVVCPPAPACPPPPPAPRCPAATVIPCPTTSPPPTIVSAPAPQPVAPRPAPPPRPVAPAPAPAADGVPRPEDLSRAHAAQTERIRRCLREDHPHRHIRLAITYDRATGRPADVRLTGAFASRPEASCITDAVRAVSLPPFGVGRWEHRWALYVGPGGVTPQRAPR